MEAARDYPDDVHVLEVDGREFVLVGTAHISRESAELVREVIEEERPDAVCVELDTQRYHALAQKRRWDSLDLKQVIRSKQLSALIVNLLLVSYQKKLGGALGVVPGTELLEATKVAEEHGIPVSLCDRDVRITLRRTWASMSFFKKTQLLIVLLRLLPARRAQPIKRFLLQLKHRLAVKQTVKQWIVCSRKQCPSSARLRKSTLTPRLSRRFLCPLQPQRAFRQTGKWLPQRVTSPADPDARPSQQ